MGHLCCKIHVTRLLNLLRRLVLYSLSLVSRKHVVVGEDEHRPSPALLPVPFTMPRHALVKEKLRVMELGEFLHKRQTRSLGDECEGESHECAVCLNGVERTQEIRELSNCAHVYHRECLDGWLEQGHETCPLCRLRVLPVPEAHDSWRSERMVYLFGQDCLFSSL